MQDRPTAIELLRAVREHLERAVLPQIADPKLKFQTLVCANVVAIVEREMETREPFAREEWVGLASLIGATENPVTLGETEHAVAARTRELCAQIRAGDWDDGDRRRRVLDHVRRTVRAKLAVANPRYASVK
jgi:hypothetical protein